MTTSPVYKGEKKDEKYVKDLLKKALTSVGTFQQEEFTYYGGSQRPDYVVLERDRFHYYEIKSECDDFSRLPKQYEKAKGLFTHLNLIINRNRLEEYLKIQPLCDWNVYFIEDLENGKFKHGEPQITSHDNIKTPSIKYISGILWTGELRRYVKAFNPTTKSNYYGKVKTISNMGQYQLATFFELYYSDNQSLQLLNEILPNRNYIFRKNREMRETVKNSLKK